jgi:hypothetical protein
MTLDVQPAGIPADRPDQERPADPRPAWERIAYTGLAREIDAGQPVHPATLADEVSVAPGFARDLVRVLRAHRHHDPELAELRGRLVRDQLTDAYLTRELAGGQPLDPAALAAEVGTTSTVARQWLHTLRTGQQSDRRLASLRAEPTSHGDRPPTSSPRCRPPTPAAADPPATTATQQGRRWSASSSATSNVRSPAMSRWTRPPWPGRSG